MHVDHISPLVVETSREREECAPRAGCNHVMPPALTPLRSAALPWRDGGQVGGGPVQCSLFAVVRWEGRTCSLFGVHSGVPGSLKTGSNMSRALLLTTSLGGMVQQCLMKCLWKVEETTK